MKKNNWLERPVHPAFPNFTNELAIFVVIVLLAIITRFYDLGTRVMSHDESLHTYFSWLLYRGQGYRHTPMMHGPFQFHIIALTYFLFGASDFTARIPSVLFSIATVVMVWYWRRYLGKWGALIAGVLLVISPYMLFYGRYVRNESFVGFSGIVMLYALLRHLETGGKKYLFIVAGALALHFTSKETAFIYTAEALIYLAVYFFAKVTREPWENTGFYKSFIISLGIAVLLASFAVTYGLYSRTAAAPAAAQTAMPANPNVTSAPTATPGASPLSPVTIILALTVLVLIAAAYFLIRGYTWERIRNERSFELLMIFGTIVLPMLTAFPIKFLGNYLAVSIPTTPEEVQALSGDMQGIAIIGSILVFMFILSAVIGLIWNREKWWKAALIFWIPFTILYTTVFTNSDGFFTGTIGSLGYWLVQQGVERGSQPWYYYILVQIPMYEFLPALGFFFALIVGLFRKPAQPVQIAEVESAPAEVPPTGEINNEEAINLIQAEEVQVQAISTQSPDTEEENFPNTFSLLIWWSIISVVAFSAAGEKMPWLTYHIALPMILITGWVLGRMVDTTDWERLKEQRVWLAIGSVAVFIASLAGMIASLGGATLPFQGKDLAQLQATSAFLLPTLVAVLSAAGMTYLFSQWTFKDIRHIFVLVIFGFLAVLTMRASFRASYIAYDQATEFLVYAHGATGIKDIMAQAKEISERTTGGMGVAIAYDASAPDTGVSWPFVWYLRDYTNQRSFDQPSRSLRDSVLVIVDEKNFDKIEPALGNGYYRMDYIRMWWPMQDYFTVSYERDPNQPFPDDYACNGIFSIYKLDAKRDYTPFCRGFTDPKLRSALFKIWWDRDYSEYAQLNNRPDLTLTTWSPADKMRLYIRKDVAAQIWNYGVAPTTVDTQKDPTEGKYIQLASDLIFDTTQANPTPLNAPRSLAFAKDGTLYVADSRNHRVVHFNLQGKVINQWGTFADGVNTQIGNGTFNEPWGIAVANDGSVYVTDTWNHRIEKFDANGKFIKAWGVFGQAETPESFYGPRGLAVDSQGRVYVTDTGNKRVVVFDANGNYLTQFGGGGMEPGQFDEPVGIALDKAGNVYVVDTWNQRIQIFKPIEADGNITFVPDKQWDVYGWFGQSVENKPFIAVNDAGHVFITDPDGFRVQELDPTGALVRVWGDFGNTPATFGLPSGITIDSTGHVWVTDSANNRVMRFTLP